MKITITVCDVCNEVGVETTKYTVRRGGEEVEVDLCEDDAAPLEDLFDQPEPERTLAPKFEAPAEKAPAKKPGKAGPTKRTAAKKTTAKRATGRRRSAKVTTLEEIEAQKQS